MRLRVGAVGKKDARDMSTTHLARVLGTALADHRAHVLAGERATNVRQRQEPEIFRARDAASGGKLVADRREDRPAAGEHADDLELRHLAQPREQPHATQQRTRDEATRSVHARRERRDRALRLLRAAGELRIGRGGSVGDAAVRRDSGAKVRRILRPARQAEIDLRHGAMPVAFEERAKRTVLGCAIVARRSRDVPQREIHLRRRVEG